MLSVVVILIWLHIKISDMEVFPGDPEVKIDVIHTHEKDSWELRHISMGSHTGTHVDAYSHMHKNRETLDEIPIERFFGKAQVVELSKSWPRKTGLFFYRRGRNRIIK